MQCPPVLVHVLLIFGLVPWIRAKASEQTSDEKEAVQLFEPTSLAAFLTKYGEKTGSPSVGKNQEKLNTDEILRNYGKSYPEETDDKVANFKRDCKNFEKSSSAMRFAQDTVRQTSEACKEFLSNPTQETLERLEDLEENMASEYLCLTRGVTYGLESGCPAESRGNRRSLYESQKRIPNDDLPDAENILEFNRNLASYCRKRGRYGNLRSDKKRGDRLAQSLMSYMNCLCDNRTDCGHLAHAAVKSFDENFVSPVTKEMNEMIDEGQKTETELERHKLVNDEDLVVPENITVQEAVQKMQHAKENEQRLKRSIDFDLSLPGCSISLDHTGSSFVQSFSCKVYTVMKISLTLEWRSLLPKVQLDVSLCIPVLDDLIGDLTSKYPDLKFVLSRLNINGGCMFVASAMADFHYGIFEASLGPNLSLGVVRASCQSTFLYRFDTRKPKNSYRVRNRYNKYGRRKYVQLTSKIKAEYFWYGWKCAYCKTLYSNTWKI